MTITKNHLLVPLLSKNSIVFFPYILGKKMDESEVGEWLQADTGNRGYEHLSDAEIIMEVTNKLTQVVSDDETNTATEPLGDSPSASASITHGHKH